MFSGWIKWRGMTLAFSTLANCLISFPGSLQVLSAIWLWAPGRCGKVHCHGDDEGHPGHPSETLPCADFARSVCWEDAEEKWLIFASRWNQRPAGNDFHPKKFRQVPRALKKFGQSLPQSTAQQYPHGNHPSLPGGPPHMNDHGLCHFIGLPPVGCQLARRDTVHLTRSKPDTSLQEKIEAKSLYRKLQP